jgi:thiamine-monophosphate kinase
MTAFQIGWFIVSINLSDIAAKGGTPLGLVVSFGLPKKTTDTFLMDLAKGADTCATTFGTHIIGGDTKEIDDITLCGTAFGLVNINEFMPRKGAYPDNIVAVTGKLGKAGAGHVNLKNKFFNNDISSLLFEPVPKLKEGKILASQKCVTSCMDLSDGLSSSLYQLHELNNVGFEINKNNLPIAEELFQFKEKQIDINIYDYALHFGGDYELLLTIPRSDFKKTQEIMRKNGFILTDIGIVTKNKEIVIKSGIKKELIENRGYEHFKKKFF